MVVISSLVAAITPTGGFVTALLLAWSFNVWCGMRADGVINIKCQNWSWRKFAHALAELCMYLLIVEVVALITYSCGDANEGIFACKTINYVFVWYNIENGLKNLCKSYPKNRAFWIVYLFIRFEFTKMLRIDDLIKMYEEHVQKQEHS